MHMPYMPVSSYVDMREYINIYASYELKAINNVIRSTGIHSFYIPDHLSLNKYAYCIEYVHVCFTVMLQQFAYKPQVNVHITQKITKMQFLPCYCHMPHVCHQ